MGQAITRWITTIKCSCGSSSFLTRIERGGSTMPKHIGTSEHMQGITGPILKGQSLKDRTEWSSNLIRSEELLTYTPDTRGKIGHKRSPLLLRGLMKSQLIYSQMSCITSMTRAMRTTSSPKPLSMRLRRDWRSSASTWTTRKTRSTVISNFTGNPSTH